MDDYTASLTDVGIPFELLDVPEIARRWPQFALPTGTVGLYQSRGAIVPAGRGTVLMQKLAVAAGAELRGSTRVLEVTDGPSGVTVTTADATVVADRVVVCADAWTNEVLAGLDVRLPLETTLEQATYFAPERPGSFAPHHLPLWIWMDDPSYYGFPCYGEPTVKAAQDCGGPVIDTSDPLSRTSEPDPAMQERLATFMACGAAGVRSAGPVDPLPVHAHSRPRLRACAGSRPRVGRRRSGRRARLQVRADVRTGAGRPRRDGLHHQ